MSGARIIPRLAAARARLRRFRDAEDGAFLVEYTMALMFFLLLFFALLDFGRMAFHYVTANRAMHVAARVAAVRPPACPGVPTINQRGPVSPSTVPPRYGARCSSGANVCADGGTVVCTGDAGNTTSSEIWALVQGTLPNDSTIANLRFSYTYDSDMGFLGGPYTPMVTVELTNINFDFVTPLAAFVRLTNGTPSANLGASVPFPSMSVSMPGEDLSHGGG